MRRRTVLLTAGGLLSLSAVGYAASEDGMLSGAPDEVAGTVSEPGVLDFNTAGVQRVSWEARAGGNAAMRIDFADPKPDGIRLHRPDGKRIWALSDTTGRQNVEKSFKLPIVDVGTWNLVSNINASYTSLNIPVTPAFSIDTYSLKGNTLVVDISNPSNAPNYIDYIRISPKAKGYGERWEPRTPLMPGETFHLEEEYPLDYYKDVELWVVSGNEIPLTKQTKSFV